MSRGWIYCLSNPAFPNLLKIGQTKNLPNIRSEQLYTTGVPHPFKIEFAKKINNYEKREKVIHSILERFIPRVNPKREFFEGNVKDVKPLFDLIDGEDYFEPSEDENILLKHILTEGQKVKHVVGDKERIACYSREKELLFWNNKHVRMLEFAGIHIKETKIKERPNLDQFQLEIDNSYVPLKQIMSPSIP